MAHSPGPRTLAVVLGACVAAALAGCDVTIRDGDVSVDRLHGRATEHWSRSYPLDPGGSVEIWNTNGGIDVAVGEPGTVSVTASLTARAMTDDRARSMLEEGRIDEVVSAGRVKLATRYDGRRGRDERQGDGRGEGRGRGRGLEVNYSLTVPPDARLDITCGRGTLTAAGLQGPVKAVVTNGNVELAGLRGAVDAAVVNGAIVVRMDAVLEPLRLESTNGRIQLDVPRDAKAVLKALAVNGRILLSGLPSAEVSDRQVRNLETVLNGGGPVIDLRVTNGRIAVTGK